MSAAAARCGRSASSASSSSRSPAGTDSRSRMVIQLLVRVRQASGDSSFGTIFHGWKSVRDGLGTRCAGDPMRPSALGLVLTARRPLRSGSRWTRLKPATRLFEAGRPVVFRPAASGCSSSSDNCRCDPGHETSPEDRISKAPPLTGPGQRPGLLPTPRGCAAPPSWCCAAGRRWSSGRHRPAPESAGRRVPSPPRRRRRRPGGSGPRGW